MFKSLKLCFKKVCFCTHNHCRAPNKLYFKFTYVLKEITTAYDIENSMKINPKN